MNRHDVGMIQPRGHIGFADKPCPKIEVTRQLRSKDFQGFATRQIGITRQIYGAHSAGT
ncbi:Uncharacterised protein [Mycobacterium tuberculosis]|uniref:Uncharacterized protein n=2 Tax=Mycobacterium tuberculosis TaxID=1773 RepID=A0A0U0TJS7_MYCTX|nr:Uncharacterised protein [Mycobacterium tuberculosis]COX63532.1 Uncharacterised protein [Mycobacterium tuberculosis]COX65515.1 Uncharacterised protein [Mycobacterium tuberculosis]